MVRHVYYPGSCIYSLIVAVLAGIMYDHVLTFHQEISLFWRRGFTTATIMFLLNRYVIVARIVCYMVILFWTPPSITVSIIQHMHNNILIYAKGYDHCSVFVLLFRNICSRCSRIMRVEGVLNVTQSVIIGGQHQTCPPNLKL